MSTHPSPDPVESFWRGHVAALARSNQKVATYATEHGLKADSLYRWRRRLRALGEDPPAPVAAPRLAPVVVESPLLCELLLPDGRALRFPASLAPETLRALLAALVAS